MKTTYGFSRRGPDRVAEELATVLSTQVSYEFKALFDIVFANLRARNAANGGEEMLRLRAYEKLQNLVQAGVIKRVGKEYQGVAPALKNFLATAAEMNAKFADGAQNGSVSSPAAAKKTKSPAAAVTTKSAAAKPVRRRTS